MSVALVMANGPAADREEFARVERIARALMVKKPRMSLAEAVSIVRLASPRPATVKAQTTVRSVEPEDEPWPAGKMLLIRGSEGTYV